MTTTKLNVCNIRGLSRKSNLNDVHQHLEKEKPPFLGLTETILDANKSKGPDYQFENYTLHSKFRKKSGVCSYIRKDTPNRRLTNLESNEFDALWIKIAIGHSIKISCLIYLPPKDPRYQKNFDFLLDCHSSILKEFPSSEISFLGDINVHNKNWLKFSSQNSPTGSVPELFSTACELTQIINGHTRVPDKLMKNPIFSIISSLPILYHMRLKFRSL